MVECCSEVGRSLTTQTHLGLDRSSERSVHGVRISAVCDEVASNEEEGRELSSSSTLTLDAVVFASESGYTALVVMKKGAKGWVMLGH